MVNPLSNFHQAPMRIDNTVYSCTEQYYQYKKADFLHDVDKMMKIMSTS